MPLDMNRLITDDPMTEPVLVTQGEGSLTRKGLIDAIDAATSQANAAVQGFDPRSVVGEAHLQAAARRALRSHAQERAIARNPSVEMALYAAGTTQISEALDRVGVPESGEGVVLVAVGPDREEATEAVLDALGLDRGSVQGQGVEALRRLGIREEAIEQAGAEDAVLVALETVALLDAR